MQDQTPQQASEQGGGADQPCSKLASRRATRALLQRYDLSMKKSLGQNFLVDDGVIGRILALSRPASDDLVLEVGPGIGTLTVALLPRVAGVVAIERDPALYPVLAETTEDASDRFELIRGDALATTFEQIASASEAIAQRTRRDPALPTLPNMLVANLPYSVAATVILDFLERFDFIGSATVMVQKEVADRIAANPGTKDYGAYTVCLRLIAQTVGRFEVGAESFVPPPHVDSAVVRLERTAPTMPDGTPASPEVRTAGALAAKAAFSQRRKTIRNSMGTYLGRIGVSHDVLDQVLAAADVEPTIRGEALPVETYLALGQALLAHGVGA